MEKKNNIADEIEKLKKDLYKKKEEVHDIKQLVKKKIDREFSSDIEELSVRELVSQMDENHSLLNRLVDPFPDKEFIRSHRKRIGKPVVWFKRILLKITRPYITLILDKQKLFNQACVDLFQNLMVHQKRYHQKIIQIEERIGSCEVQMEAMAKRIEDLSMESDKDETDSPSGQAEEEDS